MATDIKVVSGFTNEANPEIFDIRAMPPKPKKKPGQLPEEVIRKYFEDVSKFSQISSDGSIILLLVSSRTASPIYG